MLISKFFWLTRPTPLMEFPLRITTAWRVIPPALWITADASLIIFNQLLIVHIMFICVQKVRISPVLFTRRSAVCFTARRSGVFTRSAVTQSTSKVMVVHSGYEHLSFISSVNKASASFFMWTGAPESVFYRHSKWIFLSCQMTLVM